jgi:hypothetical protein
MGEFADHGLDGKGPRDVRHRTSLAHIFSTIRIAGRSLEPHGTDIIANLT